MRGLLDRNHCIVTFLIVFLPFFNKDQRSFPVISVMAGNGTLLFCGIGYLGETKNQKYISQNKMGELAEHILITR